MQRQAVLVSRKYQVYCYSYHNIYRYRVSLDWLIWTYLST